MALVTIKCDTVWKYYDHVNKLWHVLPNQDEEGNLLPSSVMSGNFKDVTAQGFAVVKFYYIKDRHDLDPVGWSAIQHNNQRNLPEDFDFINTDNVIIHNQNNYSNNKSQQRFTPQSLQVKAQTYEPTEAPF